MRQTITSFLKRIVDFHIDLVEAMDYDEYQYLKSEIVILKKQVKELQAVCQKDSS